MIDDKIIQDILKITKEKLGKVSKHLYTDEDGKTFEYGVDYEYNEGDKYKHGYEKSISFYIDREGISGKIEFRDDYITYDFEAGTTHTRHSATWGDYDDTKTLFYCDTVLHMTKSIQMANSFAEIPLEYQRKYKIESVL